MAPIAFSTEQKIPSLEICPEKIRPEIILTTRESFRKITIKCKPVEGPSGSASVELGSTKVICVVNGPREKSTSDSLEGTLNVILHGVDSSSARKTVDSALNSVVCLKKLLRAEVDIELNVLSDDGGSLAACLIAAGVALTLANIEMFDVILACHFLVAFESGHLILDPAANEIPPGGFSNITIGVIPSLGQIICLDVNGTLKQDVLNRVLKFGYDNCLKLYPLVTKTLTDSLRSSSID